MLWLAWSLEAASCWEEPPSLIVATSLVSRSLNIAANSRWAVTPDGAKPVLPPWSWPGSLIIFCLFSKAIWSTKDFKSSIKNLFNDANVNTTRSPLSSNTTLRPTTLKSELELKTPSSSNVTSSPTPTTLGNTVSKSITSTSIVVTGSFWAANNSCANRVHSALVFNRRST